MRNVYFTCESKCFYCSFTFHYIFCSVYGQDFFFYSMLIIFSHLTLHEFCIVSPPPLLSNCPFLCNVRVNSSREHPPRATPRAYPGKLKNCSCTQFLLANSPPPVPTMMVKSLANPRPPKPCDQYAKVLVAIFN